MRRTLLIIVVIALVGLALWGYFGGVEEVTERRVETALVEAGVPQEQAGCMAARMTERLTLNQLRKLERLGAQQGETPVPLSPGEILTRVRRVDDPQAVEVTATAAAICALGFGGRAE
ncbi:hypothetical protein A9995_01545 [Erythrobacter sp. QSSC1-22B]|uniref:hypothetical protein n=1 Tax=Erythrobacter sp. QSSC1-22B TaxID=1860125 RepID=UPI000805D849|nr:hypothetical protein [Erythrobacter sp. QSSC1-22B]OBX20428.1 hypothetical protein A9995_01545 [Erythrobacter sp. QSSC1-22B]